MRSEKVGHSVTIWDLSIKYYGSVQAVFILLEDNDWSLDDEPQAGDVVLIKDSVPFVTDENIAVAKYFERVDLDPSTGDYVPTGQIKELYVEAGYVDENYIE